MRKTLLPLSVALLAAFVAWAGAASPQTSSSKTTSTKKKSTVRRAPAKRTPVVVHHTPQQPSPDRLKEIQQALASRGYFNGEPDGTWGPASIDALKRFQHDQNLVEDGKIGSLSLIALGLGPKHDTEQKAP